VRRTAAFTLALALSPAALAPAACGGATLGSASDIGLADGGLADHTTSYPNDSGPAVGDGGPRADAGGDSYASGGGAVDAGYYYGDGSYWVDGGAYPPSDSGGQGSADGATSSVDASSGCGALSACCGTLPPTSQSLCNTIAGLGDPTNCVTELEQLQAEGDCTGVSVLASQIQVPPNRLVSDGTLLFWTTAATPGLLAMPVGGGPITVLLDGPISNQCGHSSFLAVDSVNLYLLQNDELVRIPKNGAAPTLVNESGAVVLGATTLGATAYWLEMAVGQSGCGGLDQTLVVRSGALLGGPISTIATFLSPSGPPASQIAVTSSTVFVNVASSWLSQVPPIYAPEAGAAAVPSGNGSTSVTSDTNAVYCSQTQGSNLRIAGDGTATALGPAVDSSYIVEDDTYVYWVDETNVGTIMMAPKTGGGTATVLTRDTNPTAIAVDATSVYWSDTGGNIESIPK